MSRIKCFGLHWRWDLVELDDHYIYGWQPTYSRWRQEPDDPEIVINDQVGVYALQSNTREIVYVGQSGRGNSRLGNRLWAHTRNKNRDRWTHFSWFGLTEPSKYADTEVPAITGQEGPEEANPDGGEFDLDLNELEALLITLIEPRLNSASGNWGQSKKYLQFSYYEDVTLHNLHRQNKKLKQKIKGIEKRMRRTHLDR